MSQVQALRRAAAECPSPLLPGARIACDGGAGALAGRLELSSGTRQAGADAELAPRYAESAFLPRPPWRRPGAAELAGLHFDSSPDAGPWRPGADVAILRIAADVFADFADMLEQHGVRECPHRKTDGPIERHPRWAANLAALNACLAGLTSGRFNQIHYRTAEPGQLTLTRDSYGAEASRQKRVGLHADHWDGLPLRHRHRGRNRICLNLGRQARYVLFINLPMMDLFRAAGLRDPEDIYTDFRGLRLGERFAKIRPDYPVIRLRLEPGEAYVLPTDNLIHDGSTEGSRYTDVTLTYLGTFVPHALAGAQER
ncbi:MAG: hypothetical protein ISP90_14430 [Nevskia sp.]|nr:hypothetical protein [Nevskia sp.]